MAEIRVYASPTIEGGFRLKIQSTVLEFQPVGLMGFCFLFGLISSLLFLAVSI